MKCVLAKSGVRVFQQVGPCLALVIIFALIVVARPQRPATNNNVLPPPRPNLAPLHWPDLSKLEADVREQLKAAQNELAGVARDPRTPNARLSEAYGTTGQIYQAYALNFPARECYLNAVTLAPQDFRWVYLLGKLDQEEDRVDEAIRRYRMARTLRPDYVAVPVNLGNIYLQLNRLADAQENFKAAQAIDENSAAALYGLGQVALAQRNFTIAVNYLEKALTLIPGANRIHYSLAMAYRGLGDTDQAKAHLIRQGPVGVRTTDPLVDGLQDLIQGERVYLSRGKLALERRRYTEAAAEFRRAIAAKPDSITAHINLGVVLVQTGDSKGAAEQYEAALRIDAQNANANYNLALLLANEERHEAAILHLQSVLSVAPNDLDARLLLARELMKSGRSDGALAEFSRVLDADSNNEDALLEQVQLLQQKRQYKQALDNLEKGHAQYPQKTRTASLLVYLLAASPQYALRDGARSLALSKTIYEATGSAEHGALVALALAELGRCNEAAEWQRRMIAAAERERKPDLVAKLGVGLKLYEGQSCRPAGETSLKDPLPSATP